jgi:hypothetical protein
MPAIREEPNPCNTSKLLLAVSLPSPCSLYEMRLPSGSATNFTSSFIFSAAMEDTACEPNQEPITSTASPPQTQLPITDPIQFCKLLLCLSPHHQPTTQRTAIAKPTTQTNQLHATSTIKLTAIGLHVKGAPHTMISRKSGARNGQLGETLGYQYCS